MPEPAADPNAAVRDAVVMGNIGISGAAVAGSGATAAMMAASAETAGAVGAVAAGGTASTGAAIGTGMAGSATTAGAGGVMGGATGGAVGVTGTGTAGTAVAAGGKAGGSALLIKIVAGAAGVAVIGGAVAVGIGVSSSSGGGKQDGTSSAEDATGPMDEGIRDVDFANITVTEPDGLADWASNQNIPAEDITLVNGIGEQVVNPDDADFGTLQFEVSQQPVYADLDGDNYLDAAMVLSTSGLVNAADFLHMLVVWQGTPDGPVQVEHNLSYVFGMHQGTWGTMVSGLAESEDGIVVTLNSSVGNLNGAGSINEDADFTLGLKDGWLVSTKPSYGAGETCPADKSAKPETVDSPGEVWIAPDQNAPLVLDPADIDHVEVNYLDPDRPFTLARVTDTDGTTHCGWIASG